MYKLNLTKKELLAVFFAVKADIKIVENDIEEFPDDYGPLLRVISKIERSLKS